MRFQWRSIASIINLFSFDERSDSAISISFSPFFSIHIFATERRCLVPLLKTCMCLLLSLASSGIATKIKVLINANCPISFLFCPQIYYFFLTYANISLLFFIFMVSPSISGGFYPPFPYRFLFLHIASYWLSTPRRYPAELPVTSDCVVPPLLSSIAPSERRLSPPPSLFIYNTHFFRIIYAQ